jgi:hypothetical protein
MKKEMKELKRTRPTLEGIGNATGSGKVECLNTGRPKVGEEADIGEGGEE